MTAGVFAKVAGAWVQVADPAGAGVPWAQVTGGTVTEYTKPDGAVVEVHTFTASGTLTVATPGYADVLVCGGGNTGTNDNRGGGGGGVRAGLLPLTADSVAVTVGAGGAAAEGSEGGDSALGSLLSVGGGKNMTALAGSAGGKMTGTLGQGGGGAVGAPSGVTGGTGYVSTISGASVEYGVGGYANAGDQTARPGKGGHGSGGSHGNGVAGIVIVAVQKTPPTVSGVVASGGTESTYTGDGTNGVLGQNYKVHTFTADGTLTVTQGGECDYFLISGGGYGDATTTAGGGGSINYGKATLGAGTVPVTVGAAGVSNTNGETATGSPSKLGSIVTSRSLMRNGTGRSLGTPWEGAGESFVSNISGTSREYGRVAGASTANRGDGNQASGGATAGVVIIRYRVN